MNEKDATVIKVLAELGLREQPQLTTEQEHLLKRALDPYEEFLSQVEHIFCEHDEFEYHPRRNNHYNFAIKRRDLMARRVSMLDDRMYELIINADVHWYTTTKDHTNPQYKRLSLRTPFGSEASDKKFYCTIDDIDPNSKLWKQLIDLDARRKYPLKQWLKLFGIPLVENDDFSKINQQQTLDHLFRVQKQRCTEIALFIDHVQTKYPSLPSLMSWPLSPSSSSSLPSSLLSLSWTSSLWTKWLRENNVSQQDIDKYQSKYNRMIEAKKAYEKAGGKYK